MIDFNARQVFCDSCNGHGLITPGNVCPICEGDGYRRMQVRLPVLTIEGPEKASCQRLAVLWVLGADDDGLALVYGVTDESERVIVAVGATLLFSAPLLTFEEVATPVASPPGGGRESRG